MYLRRSYTEEGDALLRNGFPLGVDETELLAELNACRPAGERPWNKDALTHRVRTLGLYRPQGFRSEQGRKAALARKRPDYTPKPRVISPHPRREVMDNKQKPLPLVVTLKPGRDGDLSMALMETVREVRDYAVAVCDRDTALEWGRRWARSEDLSIINDERRAHKLPIFVIR